NIRCYNGSLAFASVSSTLHTFTSPGPYVYKVSGQIYHHIGPVIPVNGAVPQFNQLYFLSPDESINQRRNLSIQEALDIQLLQVLERAIRVLDPIAYAYQMM